MSSATTTKIDVTAVAGITLAVALGAPVIDGAALIVIGMILVAVAALLVYESRALVMGETADPDLVRSIEEIASGVPAVKGIPRLLTMQLGPRHVLLNMEIQFQSEASGATVFEAVDTVERRIRKTHPEVKSIFVEAEALRLKPSSRFHNEE